MKSLNYGNIRIEDGMIYYTSHRFTNTLPCRDIIWAYHRKESVGNEADKNARKLAAGNLVLMTNRAKQYQFPMSEKDGQ